MWCRAVTLTRPQCLQRYTQGDTASTALLPVCSFVCTEAGRFRELAGEGRCRVMGGEGGGRSTAAPSDEVLLRREEGML